MTATLSVVIPVLDDAHFLRTCLAALADQDLPIDEIIVVDNGSSDDSAAVARAAGALVISERRAGIPRAAATGFDAARGDILARLDADSIPPRNWSRRVMETFTESPETSVVTGPGDFYGTARFTAVVAQKMYMSAYFRSVGVLLGQPPVFGSNYAIRSSIWRDIRGRVHDSRTDIHDDMDVSFQLEPHMRVVLDPRLRVGISARPLASTRGMVKRFYRAFVTIGVNWRERGPRQRARDRRNWRAAESSAASLTQKR